MSDLVKFDFGGNQVRTIKKGKEVWFVASDVFQILGLATGTHVHFDKLDEDEKGRCVISTPGGPQKVNVVNESGLYGLTFRSRKPEAKKFRKWVTSEVLPSIRKKGYYVKDNITSGQLSKLELLVSEMKESNRILGERNEVLMARLDQAIMDNKEMQINYDALQKKYDLFKPKRKYGEISDNGLPATGIRKGSFPADRRNKYYISTQHPFFPVLKEYLDNPTQTKFMIVSKEV